MKKPKFQYVGKEPVVLQGVGIIEPNEFIFVEVNHPLFIAVEAEKPSAPKKKK